jgi:hypothetical protein
MTSNNANKAAGNQAGITREQLITEAEQANLQEQDEAVLAFRGAIEKRDDNPESTTES